MRKLKTRLDSEMPLMLEADQTDQVCKVTAYGVETMAELLGRLAMRLELLPGCATELTL